MVDCSHCRSCEHWAPLFTGEAWGVRSFADAPDDVRAEVKAKLAANTAADGYPDDLAQFGLTESAGHWSGSWADNVPGGTDWPEWGECLRTKLESESAKTSLARAIDGSMYHAVLRCHADFGCVQWEPVDAVKKP